MAKKIEVTVVVNGQPIRTTIKAKHTAERLMRETVHTSANFGHVRDWELRDTDGRILDPGRSLTSQGVEMGRHLYLNRKAGVGGSVFLWSIWNPNASYRWVSDSLAAFV